MSQDIRKQLANNPLLLTQFTDGELEKVVETCRGKNVFFGAGIMTSNQISAAVPFDILGFFFTAEQLRRIVSGKKVFVFVADQHAITNKLFPLQLIEERTNQIINTFEKIIKNFKLKGFEIVRTINLNSVQSIRDIYASLPALENDYLKHEIADVLWLEKFHNVGIKLGWAMSSNPAVSGHDERFFDTKIQEFHPTMLSFHLKPGRTFDPKRSRVSPYISVEGESRILLQKGENVAEKLSLFEKECDVDCFKATQRHLSGIIRLHDKLFEPLTNITLKEKLQKVLNRAIS